MAAFAVPKIVQLIDYIRLDTDMTISEGEHAFFLDAVRSRTGAQVAVIYGCQAATFELNATQIRSGIPARAKDARITINAAMSEWLENLSGPVQGDTLTGVFIGRFPEVFQYGLRRLAVAPLRAGELLLGLLTLGREDATDFSPAEIEIAERASHMLAAVLERDSLRHKLLERKLVERAKGILQRRRRLSEEQAYLALRNNSRRRRIPMADLAKEIIDGGFQPSSIRHLQLS